MDVTKIVANLDEMQDFINTEIHPLISPDHYNTYCQMIDLIDVMRNHVDEIQKAQEARLLTIEDFTPEKLRDIHHVWVEIRPGYYNGDVDKYFGGKPYPAVVTGWRDIRCNAIGNVCQVMIPGGRESVFLIENDYNSGYGVKWRVWTHNPSKEQLEATPWEN